MPANYDGDRTQISSSAGPVRIACPVDSDPPNAAVINTPMQRLADWIDWARQWAVSLLSTINTWTAKQIFSDVEINGPLAMDSHRITGVADPTSDTDADTRGARNTAIGEMSTHGGTSGSCILHNFLQPWTDVVSLSVVMMATGSLTPRSVFISLVPDLDTEAMAMHVEALAGIIATVEFECMRNAISLGRILACQLVNTEPTAAMAGFFPVAASWVDPTPPPGINTYKIRARIGSQYTDPSLLPVGYMQGVRMFAHEIL